MNAHGAGALFEPLPLMLKCRIKSKKLFWIRYKAGAFTDAKKDKPGRFALAEGGMIFLDEIGDISPAMQVKLLRYK